jgi:hypothetical protein
MRTRTLKPGIFKNELLATSNPLYAWVFEGLWCIADRNGRLEDRPRQIHLEINPGRAYEGTAESIDWLVTNGFVLRYQVDGIAYLEVLAFVKHQNPHIREPARFPPPNGEGSTSLAPESTADMLGTEHGTSIGQAPTLHQTGPVPAPTLHQPSPASYLLPSTSYLLPNVSPTVVPSEPSVELKLDEDRPDPVRSVFDHWRNIHGHPRAVLDEKRRKLIAARLKDYGEALLCQAISGYKHSPHHMGVNSSGMVYDSLELILRDAAHVDTGVKLYEHPPRTDLAESTRRGIAQTEDWQPPELRRAKH